MFYIYIPYYKKFHDGGFASAEQALGRAREMYRGFYVEVFQLVDKMTVI